MGRGCGCAPFTTVDSICEQNEGDNTIPFSNEDKLVASLAETLAKALSKIFSLSCYSCYSIIFK